MTKRPQKPKERNFVAKHARNMSGAGVHKDKKGEHANRQRQKKEWRKDQDMDNINEKHEMKINVEALIHKAFGKDVRVTLKPTWEGSNYTDVTVRWPDKSEGHMQLDRKTGQTTELSGRFQIGSADEKKLIPVETVIKRALKRKPTNESMIKQMNETFTYDNSDDFTQAIKDIEKEFNICLSEETDVNKLSSEQMQELVAHVHEDLFKGKVTDNDKELTNKFYEALENVAGFETADQSSMQTIVNQLTKIYNKKYRK